MQEREAALLRGEDDLAKEITTQLQDLEERANVLDKRRSSSIELIGYINNRNRKKNIFEAEKAIMEEAKLNRGLKIEDPFTRRTTKPRMAQTGSKQFISEPEKEIMMAPEAPKPKAKAKKADEMQAASDNLYSLHDFDIEIDIGTSNNQVPVLPKPVLQNMQKSSGPKRSLNLEDYKKKRGLI